MELFPKTYCSNCGGEFGPGYYGYSHCVDHRTARGRHKRRRQVHKMLRNDMQRRLNERHMAAQSAKGMSDRWWVPFSSEQRANELNQAIWYTSYRLILLGKLMSEYERADWIRRVRCCLDAAKLCDLPVLP